MTRWKQSGLTLVELMVVVTIVGVLSTIAVFMYTKSQRKARASEVPVIFAELKVRQEQFALEHNEYLPTGSGDDELFPSFNPGRDPVNLVLADSPVPPEPYGTEYPAPSWQTLRMAPDKTQLYCGYVAITGAASDVANVGAHASTTFQLGGSISVPAQNWYYLLAQCDFDGDDLNSMYFSLSNAEGISTANAGE